MRVLNFGQRADIQLACISFKAGIFANSYTAVMLLSAVSYSSTGFKNFT